MIVQKYPKYMVLKYQHHGGLSSDFLIGGKNIYNIKLNEQKEP